MDMVYLHGQMVDNMMDMYFYLILVYFVQYVKDKKHGFGEFIYSDGSSYKGEWFEGKEHGKGTF